MNFYERAKKLRNEYLEKLKEPSTGYETKFEAEIKIYLLSQLVAKAFFDNCHYTRMELDELPECFALKTSDEEVKGTGREYQGKLLEEILESLGYEKFSISATDLLDTNIFVDFR